MIAESPSRLFFGAAIWCLVLAQGLVGVVGAAAASLAPMLESVMPAVVNISTVVKLKTPSSPLARDPVLGPLLPEQFRGDLGQSGGSGVIIDADQGYVVTNHHVVEGARSIKVALRDRREYDAQLVGSDPATDIAVLQITPERLTAMTVADSDRARIGDVVVAIGNPHGLGWTVTAGIVSALGRSQNIQGYEEYIQTDAPVNRGNSGGALANVQGELIGINTSIFALGGGGNVGTAFAVPSNTMTAVVAQLVRFGEVRRGRVGLTSVDVTPALARKLGLSAEQGAYLTRVDPDSPAHDAGLRAGDVVTTVNRRPVSSQAALRYQLALVPVGDSAELRYVRDSTVVRAQVRVAPIPVPQAQEGAITLPQFPGARLIEQPTGVTFVGIEPGSESYGMGLRSGDVIDSVNLQPIRNMVELNDALQRTPILTIGILRGESKLRLRIRSSS